MSGEMRGTAFGKRLLGLILIVVLVGLGLVAVACEELSTVAPGTASAEISMTATTVSQPASAESIYGTWEGTYTVLAAWDSDGAVNNPPVPLGTPLAMILVLHPLSGASGDYGTVDIPGFGSSRVTAVLQDGASVQLSVVSEETGRADTHSVFTLTFAGDSLAGEDSGDPAVPSGWVTTSGTIVLTRTGSWSETGADDLGAGAAGGGSGAGADGQAPYADVTIYAGPIIGTTTTIASHAPAGTGDVHLRVEDGGTPGGVQVHVGSYVYVDLPIHQNGGTGFFRSPAASLVDQLEMWADPEMIHMMFRLVAAPGPVDLAVQARYVNSLGQVVGTWQVILVVTD